MDGDLIPTTDAQLSRCLESSVARPEEKKSAAKKSRKSKKSEEIPHVEAEIIEGQTSLIPQKTEKAVDVEKQHKQLSDATQYIRKEITSIARSFCRVGFRLWQVKENELFKADGFKNISEYGERVLGFKKSSTANYIAICERFSVRNDSGKPTAQLVENFASFSYGQLSEMLSLPDEKIDRVTPESTCKEIRAMKKGESEESSPIQENASIEDYDNDPTITLFDRVLDKDNLVIAIKLLRENVGKQISILIN